MIYVVDTCECGHHEVIHDQDGCEATNCLCRGYLPHPSLFGEPPC